MSHETLFTMRGVTWVNLRHHQMLHLPHKMTLMIDPHHIWNVIYNARNNRWHPPTSPNIAPATQIDSWNFHKNFSKTAETSFTMRDRSEQDPTMIRAQDPRMKPSVRNPPRNRGYFSRPPRPFCIEKIQHFALRLSFQISPNTAPATKSDTWTSPNTAPATKSNTHHWSSSHMKRYLQCAE